jgi:hypothetical protein
MTLQTKIKDYYYANLAELSDDKQFHFATRIGAWHGDKQAFTLLTKLEPIINSDDLAGTFTEIAAKPQAGRRNAHELRQPFFEAYPRLYGAHAALFRLRHLKSVYGVDARKDFFTALDESELDSLYARLLKDAAALRILSTFAVNFIYLYKTIAKQSSEPVNPAVFLQAAEGYDLTNPLDMQLKIYLYTHCIIGDSNFYTKQVPAKNKPHYTAMLAELETLISDNFERINLDNKFEFLVCARIIGFESRLFERIDQEANNSMSPEGTFVIDTHNKNIQDDKTSFDKSEHRNVLYIMSDTPYAPHSTLIR